MNPKLSIIIGALREEKRIGKTLDTLAEFLSSEDIAQTTELVMVVAEGGDSTKDIVLEKSSKFPHFQLVEPGKPVGKGRDIKVGMLAAKGDIRLFMDADLATPLHHVKTMLAMFENEKPDIIIGTRKLSSMHSSHFRRFVSIMGNFCFLIVGGFYSPDTQCGFKGFTAHSAEICFGKLTRLKWSFDMELLTIAHSNKLEVQQIAITDWKDVPNGSFKPNLNNSWQFLKDLIRIFTNRITRRYKLKSL